MHKAIKIFFICLFLLCPFACAFAQQAPQDQKSRDKELYEATQKVVDEYTDLFGLEDWQVFYLDSILTHNNKAMMVELDRMQANKVANQALYMDVRDKWMEKTDLALQKIFTPEQWSKYMKHGGEKNRKVREKRKQKK